MLSGVYCIVSKDTDIQEVYIGSTDNLNKRIREHKCFCNNKNGKQYNFKVYQFIRENGGFNNWKFIWLEMFKTDDTIFLKQLEQNYINTFPEELLLNSFRAYMTEEEKIEQNRKDCSKYHKKNKDIISEKNKVKVPCPKCFKSMRKDSIYRHLKTCPKNTN